MPIYDQPITKSDLRPLPQISLDDNHHYKKCNAFSTPFLGKLTNKAIGRYSLLGHYGTKLQKEAHERLGEKKAKQNVKRAVEAITKQLANKYVTI